MNDYSTLGEDSTTMLAPVNPKMLVPGTTLPTQYSIECRVQQSKPKLMQFITQQSDDWRKREICFHDDFLYLCKTKDKQTIVEQANALEQLLRVKINKDNLNEVHLDFTENFIDYTLKTVVLQLTDLPMFLDRLKYHLHL